MTETVIVVPVEPSPLNESVANAALMLACVPLNPTSVREEPVHRLGAPFPSLVYPQ